MAARDLATADEVEALVRDLEEAKVAYAKAYLRARQGPPLGGRTPTVDDAHMGARIALESQGIRDPEVLRLSIYNALGIRIAGED